MEELKKLHLDLYIHLIKAQKCAESILDYYETIEEINSIALYGGTEELTEAEYNDQMDITTVYAFINMMKQVLKDGADRA